MAILPPFKNWQNISIGRDERLWVYIMIVMLAMMGIMTVGWVFLGDQNPPELYSQYENEDFLQAAIDSNDAAGLTLTTMANGESAYSLLDGVDSNGNGGDIFLVAQTFSWTVRTSTDQTSGFQIRQGETYRLHLGSIDVLHGFQLIGSNFIVSLQVVPGYDYIVDFIPNEIGLFRIICNEYCGGGHHTMMGFMEVVA